MKKICLIILAVILFFTGCQFIPGVISGSSETETYLLGLDEFSSLEIGNGIYVELIKDSHPYIEYTCNYNIQDYLTVEVVNDTLKIYLDPIYTYTDTTINASVYIDEITNISLSGASALANRDIFATGEALNIQCSGASEVIAWFDSASLSVNTSGASSVTLEGSTGDISIDSSGASFIDLTGCSGDAADVHLSGGSTCDLGEVSSISYSGSGGSLLTYTGSPSLESTNLSGDSSIESR
jgi:C1A family cysteine protease